MERLVDFEICPKCGSNECIDDYPVAGKGTCEKCGHESVRIKLKTIIEVQEILDNCPFCGKEGEEDDTLFEQGNIVIFKCKKCGKLDGYRYVYSGQQYYDPPTDDSYDSLSVEITKQEGRFVYSAEMCQKVAKALRKREKEKPHVENRNKQLNLLIDSKTREMKDVGISSETISMACWQVRKFLEGKSPVTEKQLRSIFAGALSLLQKTDQTHCSKPLGKKVTDGQLEKIFDVTRKTTRKWRKRLLAVDNLYL